MFVSLPVEPYHGVFPDHFWSLDSNVCSIPLCVTITNKWDPILTNTFSSALCVLSAVSFVPQLLRIAVRRDSSGVALFYVLFNLINATQQLTIGGIYIGFAEERPFFAWSWPQSATDWINVVQLLVFWAGTLTLYALEVLVVNPEKCLGLALTMLASQFYRLPGRHPIFSGIKGIGYPSLPLCPHNHPYSTCGSTQRPQRPTRWKEQSMVCTSRSILCTCPVLSSCCHIFRRGVILP